jgi:hypothetical protein
MIEPSVSGMLKSLERRGHKIGPIRDLIAKLEAKLNNAKALVVDMECSCMSYAKLSDGTCDGWCERCMLEKVLFSFDEEGQG